jgi:hypothetical protein
MAVATSWYEAQGYIVDDVSDRESWDLEARRSSEERRIEVKGAAGARDAVDLTKNEVRNASAWATTDLFVVDSIQVREVSGVIQTSGGRARRWGDWTPTSASLEATMYSHLLFPNAELLDVHTSISHMDSEDTA